MRNLISKKTLVTGLMLGAAAVAAIVPSISALAYGTAPTLADDGLATQFSTETHNLRLSGSTTCFPIIAHALGLSTTSTGGVGSAGPFQNANGGLYSSVLADIECLGSGHGWADNNAEANDIGLSSRAWKSSEPAGLNAIPFGRDVICIIVNNGVKVADITRQQLSDIYTGGITNWSALGGSGNIIPIARETTSGTYGSVGDFLKSYGYTATAEQSTVTHARQQTNAAMVAEVAATPNSIGYVGVGYAAAAEADGAKVLTLEGKTPTEQNVTTGAYAFSRYLYLITKPGATDTDVSGNASVISAFVNYIKSDEGQDIVKAEGYVKMVADSDINSDSIVNLYDLTQLGLKWNKSVAAHTLTAGDRADIDGNGTVNLYDLTKLGLWWGIDYVVQADKVSGGTAPGYTTP